MSYMDGFIMEERMRKLQKKREMSVNDLLNRKSNIFHLIGDIIHDFEEETGITIDYITYKKEEDVGERRISIGLNI